MPFLYKTNNLSSTGGPAYDLLTTRLHGDDPHLILNGGYLLIISDHESGRKTVQFQLLEE